MIVVRSFGQLVDEQNVTITLDLQPVLQLNMTTPDQIDFVFDQIPEYYGGEIKYAGTILQVSSTVTWDLWAVGTSQTAQAAGGLYWDLQMPYNQGAGGINALTTIPLSALELHQYPVNAYINTATDDYSAQFVANTTPQTDQVATNSIFESATPYTAPVLGNKYIMGDAGIAAAGVGGVPGGSYLANGSNSDYYITIDYRILPGLPTVFPMATDITGTTNESMDVAPAVNADAYAAPGVYTMDVKYILAEDQ